MMTEKADAFSGPELCLYIELFEFCGSFRDLAHESCIKGANHVRGGVLKSTFVVDNDTQCAMYIRTQSLPVFSLDQV